MSDAFDLVIIGAGPAGLAAAEQAATLGLAVLVLDDQPAPGGQIYRGIERAGERELAVLGPEYRHGAGLAAGLRRAGVQYEAGATVCDITRERWVGYERQGVVRFVKAEQIILATGALERPFPIAGWTLPGVMTAGAAQILLKSAAAIPGERTVLAGTGPLIYLIAAQLLRAGRRIQAVLDTTPPGNYPRALPALPRALGSPSTLVKGLRMIAGLRRAGGRHVTGVTEFRAEGSGAVEAVVFRAGRREERLATDLLLLHQGVVPNIQLTQALRCEHVWDDLQLCWRPVLDAWGATSLEGVTVAGDGGGIQGAMAAELQGRLAAIQAAFRLGRVDAAERDRLAAPIRPALRREQGLRPFLDRLYRPADQFRVPADDEVIACRCEEVTVGAIRSTVELGAVGPNQLKSFLRAGMGPCQGRMCGLTVCETIAKHRGVAPGEIGYYRLRPPIRPVALGALAAMQLPQAANGSDADAAEEERHTVEV